MPKVFLGQNKHGKTKSNIDLKPFVFKDITAAFEVEEEFSEEISSNNQRQENFGKMASQGTAREIIQDDIDPMNIR
jgi:hypothetical protein